MTFRELGDQAWEAHSLTALGRVATAAGDFASAEAFFAQSMALYRALDMKGNIAEVLGNLGWLAERQGDWQRAEELFAESLGPYRARDGILAGWLLHRLGSVAARRGDHEQAQALLAESLILERKLGNKWGIAAGLATTAALAIAQGHPERGTRLLGAVETLQDALGIDREDEARVEADSSVAAARAALDETAFAAAWVEGRAMTWEHAVEYALEATDG